MDKPYWFDEASGIISYEAEAASTFVERWVVVNEMMFDCELPKHASVLINVSAVIQPPTPEQLSKVGLLFKSLCQRFGGRVAIVNAKVGHSTLSHLAAAMAEKDTCRAFLLEADAIKWLKSTVVDN